MKIFEGKQHIFDVDDVVRIERNTKTRKGYNVYLSDGSNIYLTTFEKNKVVDLMKEASTPERSMLSD